MTGLQAALAAEDPLRCPPAGPATDPGFDQAILEPLVRNYDRALRRPATSAGAARAAAEITEAPSAGSSNPPGSPPGTPSRCCTPCPRPPSADRRWADDRDSFTRFSSYLADGGLPQPRRDRAATAAARLDRLERAQAAYDAERALEDPFVLAELRTTGEAFGGHGRVRRAVAHRAPAPTGRVDPAATLHRPHRRPRAHRAGTAADLPRTPRPARPDHRAGPRRRGRRSSSWRSPTAWAPPPGRGLAPCPAIGEQVSYTLDPGYFAQREFPPPEPDPLDARRPAAQAARQSQPRSASHDRVPSLRPGRRDRPRHRRRPGRHDRPGQRGIIVDSPPGAGKSTLVVRAAADLAAGGETCIIVAQTNNQVDDLTARLAGHRPGQRIGRLSATDYIAARGLLASPASSVADQRR